MIQQIANLAQSIFGPGNAFTHRGWRLELKERYPSSYPYSLIVTRPDGKARVFVDYFEFPLSAVAHAVRMIDEGAWK